MSDDFSPSLPNIPEMTPAQRDAAHYLHRSMVQTLTVRHHAVGVLVVATLRTLAWALSLIPDSAAREQTIGAIANVLPLYVNLFRPQKEK